MPPVYLLCAMHHSSTENTVMMKLNMTNYIIGILKLMGEKDK